MIDVQTGWTGTGTKADPYRPAVVDEYGLATWTDMTGAEPGPGGAFTVRIADTQAKEDAIRADPKYATKGVALVVSVSVKTSG